MVGERELLAVDSLGTIPALGWARTVSFGYLYSIQWRGTVPELRTKGPNLRLADVWPPGVRRDVRYEVAYTAEDALTQSRIWAAEAGLGDFQVISLGPA